MLQLYNNAVYNQTQISTTMVVDDIAFNNFGLLNSVYYVQSVNWDSTPQIELNDYNKPLNDWWVLISRYYRQRVITMQWTIRNPWSLQQAIDTIKSRLRGTDWNLDIRLNGELRRIKATVNSITIEKQHYHIDFVPFSVVFVAQEPFFYEVDPWTLLLDSITWDITNAEITNTWFVEVPVLFRYVGGSSSAVTELKFTIWWEEIDVVASVGNGDILEIDGEERICTLNGDQIAFEWVFGKIPLGKSLFSIDFTWTVAWDVIILYKISYL